MRPKSSAQPRELVSGACRLGCEGIGIRATTKTRTPGVTASHQLLQCLNYGLEVEASHMRLVPRHSVVHEDVPPASHPLAVTGREQTKPFGVVFVSSMRPELVPAQLLVFHAGPHVDGQ